MSDFDDQEFGTIQKTKDANGRVTAKRKTTVMQDLRDIGRMATGGRGGRQRSQAIDDEVEKMQR